MPGKYDLLLKGGRVIDPAAKVDGKLDVAVKDGRIAAVEADIPDAGAGEVIDVSGRLVLPGMIDSHAHVYQHVSGRFGLNPDLVGVRSGVTCLVDQGGPSSMTFPGFRKFIVEPSASRIYAFISAYVVGGLEGHYYPDLYGPSGIDVEGCVRAIDANRDLVKGIKAHAEIAGYARWGLEVIKLAKAESRGSGLPVYVHLGQLWPMSEAESAAAVAGGDADKVVGGVVELLEAGDVLAHPFTRHPGGFVNQAGEVHPAVREALAKGLLIDIGHGSHFSFDMARKVLDAGILPHTVGADMHGYNTTVPGEGEDDEMNLFKGDVRFSLVHAMNELLALGISLEDVVPMVTSNCAALLKLEDEIGTLKPGVDADVSVLADERGDWVLRDNIGDSVTADRLLQPLFCLRAGVHHEADASILPLAEAA